LQPIDGSELSPPLRHAAPGTESASRHPWFFVQSHAARHKHTKKTQKIQNRFDKAKRMGSLHKINRSPFDSVAA
jgi:hypothetical protein